MDAIARSTSAGTNAAPSDSKEDTIAKVNETKGHDMDMDYDLEMQYEDRTQLDDDYEPGDEFDWDRNDSRQYCKHGTFIGSWWGPDILCGPCEMGD